MDSLNLPLDTNQNPVFVARSLPNWQGSAVGAGLVSDPAGSLLVEVDWTNSGVKNLVITASAFKPDGSEIAVWRSVATVKRVSGAITLLDGTGLTSFLAVTASFGSDAANWRLGIAHNSAQTKLQIKFDTQNAAQTDVLWRIAVQYVEVGT